VTCEAYFLPLQVVSLTIFAAVTSDAEATMREDREENNMLTIWRTTKEYTREVRLRTTRKFDKVIHNPST
jgi:hypothetical protein